MLEVEQPHENIDMTDWQAIRKQVPATLQYIYLNSAEGAPICQAAASSAKRYYDEMLEHGDLLWEDWLLQKEAIRQQVADFIHAKPHEIAFTSNTSMAMNLIAAMLENKGDVLTPEDEFPSTTFPWLHRNTPLHFLKSRHYSYPTQLIGDAFKHNSRVGIFVASHVQYKTGFRQDLVATGQLCQQHNKIYVVNATQSIGAFPIDVKQANIDFLAFTSLKWAMAGYGIGVIYINEKWLEHIKFPIAGWQSVEDPGAMNNQVLTLKKQASALEVGTPHFPNIFALGGSINWFAQIGKDEIKERILALNQYLVAECQKHGFEIITPLTPTARSGICVIKLANPEEVVEQLAQKNIIVSKRGEGIRVSTHLFNTEEDIDQFILALLPIYKN